MCTEEEYKEYLNKCKKHCKGCLNEKSNICLEKDIIDCYLHSQLPAGIWMRASLNSVVEENTKDLTHTIDKKLVEKVMTAYNNVSVPRKFRRNKK